MCWFYGWKWEDVERMPFRDFRRARSAGMRVYGQNRLHDIDCNNLAFCEQDSVEKVRADFMALRDGRQEDSGNDLESLKAYVGAHG